MANAGALTLRNGGVTLGTLTYGPETAGFGYGMGYRILMLNPTHWNPGDNLSVQGSGADIGPFTATAPAVAMLSVDTPLSLSRTKSLSLTWSPDNNAQTVVLTIDAYGPSSSSSKAHGTITCTVPDSAGAVNVDTSLLGKLSSGDECWVTLRRAHEQLVQTSTGAVTFATEAVDEVIVPVE
jgi:hypothetical protein